MNLSPLAAFSSGWMRTFFQYAPCPGQAQRFRAGWARCEHCPLTTALFVWFLSSKSGSGARGEPSSLGVRRGGGGVAELYLCGCGVGVRFNRMGGNLYSGDPKEWAPFYAKADSPPSQKKIRAGGNPARLNYSGLQGLEAREAQSGGR